LGELDARERHARIVGAAAPRWRWPTGSARTIEVKLAGGGLHARSKGRALGAPFRPRDDADGDAVEQRGESGCERGHVLAYERARGNALPHDLPESPHPPSVELRDELQGGFEDGLPALFISRFAACPHPACSGLNDRLVSHSNPRRTAAGARGGAPGWATSGISRSRSCSWAPGTGGRRTSSRPSAPAASTTTCTTTRSCPATTTIPTRSTSGSSIPSSSGTSARS